MASKQTLFRIFYRVGFTPWDGHPLAQSVRDLVEGTPNAAALPAGSALEVGCGTGDCSIYLAQHGWKVTAVDFVAKPLERARAKAHAAGAAVDFVQADVTQLSRTGIGANFELIVDNGCLHNMSDADRDAYVREITALAAPGARLLIVAFVPGGRVGVRGGRPRRDGTPLRARLDAVVRRRGTRAGPRREDAGVVLPVPTAPLTGEQT